MHNAMSYLTTQWARVCACALLALLPSSSTQAVYLKSKNERSSKYKY